MPTPTEPDNKSGNNSSEKAVQEKVAQEKAAIKIQKFFRAKKKLLEGEKLLNTLTVAAKSISQDLNATMGPILDKVQPKSNTNKPKEDSPSASTNTTPNDPRQKQ